MGLSKVFCLFCLQVDIKASTNDTSPGEEVTLKMTAAPSSYVGLLAVDQSVLLLRSGNDITEDQVSASH